MVVRARADRYTLLMVGPSSTINPTLDDKLGFFFLRDTAPVASVFRQPQVILAHLPTGGVPGFIAYAKANPGKITMASAATGSSGRLAGEMFQMMAGIHLCQSPIAVPARH